MPVAIYHASLKTFSRALGHSSVAAAAYRVGASFTDERTGVRHDYSIRSGVACSQVLLPPGAPSCFLSVPHLWNAAEAAEKRINSCVARELIVALPSELDEGQRLMLALRLGQMLVDRYQVGLTLAVHTPNGKGDDRNHHVHLLFSTRTLGPDGFGAKTRVLDDKATGPAEVRVIREAVAKLTNEALLLAGSAVRVDHRSLDAQAEEAAERGDTEAVVRFSRPPTTHEGKAATVRKRRGEHMDRVTLNAHRREGGAALLREHLKAQATTSDGPPSMTGARTHLEGSSMIDGGREPLRITRTWKQHRSTPRARRLSQPSTRLASVTASPNVVYLHLLQQAARDAGVIAQAYIDILKVTGEEATSLMQRSESDPSFALLLQRIRESRDEALTTPQLSALRPTRSHARAHARWRAFERKRQRLLQLPSDAQNVARETLQGGVRPLHHAARPRPRVRRL